MAQNLVVMLSSVSALFEDAFKAYGKGEEEQWDVFIVPNSNKYGLNSLAYFALRENIGGYKKKFYRELRERFLALALKYQRIIFISLPWDGEYFINAEIAALLRQKDCRVYFVDPLNETTKIFPFWDIFKKLYTYEYRDTIVYGPQHNLKLEFLPLGTRYYLYETNKKNLERNKYDCCFVGLGTQERLPYLEAVAQYATKNDLKFFVAGHFWHNSNCWNNYFSQRKFARNYPHLSKYVVNKYISPKELHDLYYETKVCLNINTAGHDTFNSRCMDIMYCGSLVLTDKENTTGYDLIAEKHFYSCTSSSEMVSKLASLLENRQEVQKNSVEAKNIVKQQYTFKQTIARMLE